jgi:dTDP-glucose 4,6-dehydratase/UDP-glucose 4-epimerase
MCFFNNAFRTESILNTKYPEFLLMLHIGEFCLNSYTKKNVLITGGLGFIGSNLAIRLVRMGAKVCIVDNLIERCGGNLFNIDGFRDDLTVKMKDVRNNSALEGLLKNVDFVFNLAGQSSHLDSMEDPQTDLDINSRAQLSILEACREFNTKLKIVFASTRQIYGKPEYLPVDESHPIRPVDVNGINKLAGEWYHLLYNNVYGIRSCALRLTNTYGPRMRVRDARQTFLGVWIRRLLEGKPLQIFGDGLQLRDFNYVDDCVDALLLAGASDQTNGNIYNLGSDEVINLKSLAEMIVKFGFGGTIEFIPFPSDRKAIDIGDYYSDFSRFRESLDWVPGVGLNEGLRKTIEYYQKHASHYWSFQ